MAPGEVRVKLQFDYPPPAVPESRQLWLLLSTEQCRAVTDLSCLIHERFYPQQRGALSLYLQDCLLPPGESARLLRDDDLIRVRWEAHETSEEANEPNSQSRATKRSKKRRRGSLEEDNESQTEIIPKRTRYLRDHEPVQRKEEEDLMDGNFDESSEKKRTKKKKKHKEAKESLPPSAPTKRGNENLNQNSSVSDQKSSTRKKPKKTKSPHRSSQGPEGAPTLGAARAPGSFSKAGKRKKSSTSSSDEEPTVSRKHVNNGTPVSAVKTPGSISKAGKRKASSTSSSEEEPTIPNRKPANRGTPAIAAKAPGSVSKAGKREASSTSSSEEEPTIPSRKPAKCEAPSNAAKSPGTLSKVGKRKESTTSSEEEPKSKVPASAAVTPVDSSRAGNESSALSVEPTAAKRNSSNSAPGKSTGNKAASSSSSSESDSSEDEATQNKPVTKVTTLPLNGTKKATAQEKSSSGSDSDTLVIKKSLMAPPTIHNGHQSGAGRGRGQQGPLPNPLVFGRGRGRGGDQPPWRGQRGGGSRGPSRGRGQQFFYNYNSEALKEQQLQEPASNVSIILQNPPDIPKRDYSAMPLLAAPPQTGKVIAFKLLELTENYTPEVSDYKEGRIMNFDPVTQQLEVELLSRQRRKEPGKFDLVYEMENGKDIEFAVPQDHKISQHWSSLIEPRLVMETGSEGQGT
ncbi:coilin [Gastrophryne carolinensis]